MRSRLLTIAGFLYVCFALITAHTAMVPCKATPTNSVPSRIKMERLDRVVYNTGPVDFVDEETTVDANDEFFIEIWVSKNCKYCEQFKKSEIPKLKEAGLRYKELDIEIFPPPKDLKYVPTIKIIRKDKEIKTYVGFTKAEKIIDFIENNLKLKK